MMRRDLEALKSAASGGVAKLHVYRFARPSVTAGRNAVVTEEMLELWRTHGHDFARRPTGGGILRHGVEDLAFGFAIPADDAFSRSELERVAAAIREALSRQGIAVERACSSANESSPRLCIERAVGAELVFRGEKILGLAARRIRGAALVQGALIVRRDERLDRLLVGAEARVDLSGEAFDPGKFAADFSEILLAPAAHADTLPR